MGRKVTGSLSALTFETGVTELTDKMELMYYNSGIKFGYVDALNATHEDVTTPFSEKDVWRYYKIDVYIPDASQTLDGITYTNEQIATQLASKKYTLSVGQTALTNSNAFFYGLGTSNAGSSAASGAAPSAAGSATPSAFTSTGTFKIQSSKDTYYFGMYVDGHSHSKDAAVSGSFTVSLTQN